MFGIIKRDQLAALPAPTSAARVIKPAELLAAKGRPAPAALPAPEATNREAYEELHRLEKGVAAHRLSWVVAGAALREIQRRELYRVRSANFEEYLRERWGLKRRQAYDLVTAAAVADNVHEVRHALSVRAALKLAKLPAEQQAACLSEAIAGSGSRSPTADYLAAAVAARLPRRTSNQRRRRAKGRPKPVRLRLASGTLICVVKKAGADLRALLIEALQELDLNQKTPGENQCAA